MRSLRTVDSRMVAGCAPLLMRLTMEVCSSLLICRGPMLESFPAPRLCAVLSSGTVCHWRPCWLALRRRPFFHAGPSGRAARPRAGIFRDLRRRHGRARRIRAILDAMDNQPEFKTPIWDYLAVMVDDQRIADGRAKLAEWPRCWREPSGSSASTGMSSSPCGRRVRFRQGRGGARCALAGDGLLLRRAAAGVLRGEFAGDLAHPRRAETSPPNVLGGSWAGAFGQTQFTPSTFHRSAVDFDGDGRRDIVGSVPDALGSTANFLGEGPVGSPGPPGGDQVRPPEGFGAAPLPQRASGGRWAMGLTRVDGRPSATTPPA